MIYSLIIKNTNFIFLRLFFYPDESHFFTLISSLALSIAFSYSNNFKRNSHE